MLILWLSAVLFEAAMHYLKPLRMLTLVGAVGLQSFLIGWLIGGPLSGYALLLGLCTAYRIFNIFRVVQGQMHHDYLQRVTRTTFWVLVAAQTVLLDIWVFSTLADFTAGTFWLILASAQVFIGLILFVSICRTLQRTVWPTTTVHLSNKELPTITVAIPARNETDDLHACLTSILASDYPKLEILVLDDCSQLKRTPEIIRGFAHAGVRFIQGSEPGKTWLAKNWAYDQLVKASSGDYIMFCGVDVRMTPQSLRQYMTVMLERRKTLVSILPERSSDSQGTLSLIQLMRYWWELAPPRRLFNRPPVLSTCWMVEADWLHRDGGFKAVSRMIAPEAYFAGKATTRDGYSFLRSSTMLGISSVKRITQQRDTVIRTRYPQLHRRPEQVLLLSLAECVLLILPFVMAVAGFWFDIGTAAHILSIVASILLIGTQELVTLTTKVNSWWFGLLAGPLTFMVDVWYIHYSMWRYEFSMVEWKGRNVCVPVMHAVPQLPKISNK
jgi:hypothetical protein